jgi:hypothetical protein
LSAALRKLNAKHFRSNFDTKPMRSFRDVETLANNDYYNQEHELAFYGRGYRSRTIGSTYKAPALVKKEFAWTPTRWSSYSSFILQQMMMTIQIFCYRPRKLFNSFW